MRILLLEDDLDIRTNLGKMLSKERYSVTYASSLEEATNRIMSEEYDLVIVDRRLPDGDGLMLVSQMRKENISIPVLMLTAKSTSYDVTTGLNEGADDYLSKPFVKSELLARVRALLRRGKELYPQIVNVGKIQVDINTCTVSMNKRLIPLSPKEYSVFEYLIRNIDKAIPRVEILTHVWGDDVDLFSNTVDVHVRYLRKKLGRDVIRTVKGMGYMVCSN